ncbi:MAG: DUF937 domain-containing protein [Rhodomicrobium sp.]
MITNLAATIAQSLSPEAIEKIAASLGSDGAAAEKAIGAAVPGILAGLANSAATPRGARRLGAVVSQIHGMPSNEITMHLLGANHQKLAKLGWAMLSRLAGSGFLQTLSSSVAEFSGVGQMAAKHLLGLLTPVVLEFLRREQIAKGLDIEGVAELLASQKGSIGRALPKEIAARILGGDMRTDGEPHRQDKVRGKATRAVRHYSYGSRALWLLAALLLAGGATYPRPVSEGRHSGLHVNRNMTIVPKTSHAPQAQVTRSGGQLYPRKRPMVVSCVDFRLRPTCV